MFRDADDEEDHREHKRGGRHHVGQPHDEPPARTLRPSPRLGGRRWAASGWFPTTHWPLPTET